MLKRRCSYGKKVAGEMVTRVSGQGKGYRSRGAGVQDAKKRWPGPRGFDLTCLSDIEAENGKTTYTTLAEGEWVGDLLLSVLK